jgi:hypothetical protein
VLLYLICVDNKGYEGFLTLYKWYKGELAHSKLPTLGIDVYGIPKHIAFNVAYLETKYKGPFDWKYRVI